MATFTWTFAGPTSTFADRLLVDGAHSSGKVVRYSRVTPAGPVRPGEPVEVIGAYYVGFLEGERVVGEHDALRGAQGAVEARQVDRTGHRAMKSSFRVCDGR